MVISPDIAGLSRFLTPPPDGRPQAVSSPVIQANYIAWSGIMEGREFRLLLSAFCARSHPATALQ